MKNDSISELLSLDPLSKCLQKVSSVLERNGSQEIKDWFRLELGGYVSSNKAMKDSTLVPEYRTVVGQHVDLYGNVLHLEPKLSFVNETRLREGVEELEAWANSRDIVVLHDPTMCSLIREHLKVEVYYFRFSAVCLTGLFSAIRSEAAERLHSLPEVSVSLANSKLDDEVIQLRPNFYGLGIDLRALWRRYWKPNSQTDHEV